MAFRVAGSSLFSSISRVIALFLIWKLLLLVLAALSPGPGYDTSSSLLLPVVDVEKYPSIPSQASARVLNRLVRWDALHFIGVAQHGDRYEQDRAWGWLYTTVLTSATKAPRTVPPLPPDYAVPLAAARLSHAFHLLSTLLLFLLTYINLPGEETWRRSTAFVASCLYIISPAGIFLSAPYSESFFAFFNFLGMLAVSRLRPRSGSLPDTLRQTLFTICSGIFFAIGCMIRSNGILSLLVYVEPGLVLLSELLGGPLRLPAFVKLVGQDVRRPWCDNFPPSIYNFVQQRYWDVGFLRYWTLSNLPLFLIALPMLSLLLLTAWICLNGRQMLAKYRPPPSSQSNDLVTRQVSFPYAFRQMALPQAALAILALTNFHVQIINRISSGYPLWYIVLAIAITTTKGTLAGKTSEHPVLYGIPYLSNKKTQKRVVRGMIMYAMIQGGLFASFLPPA
ncbi:hypothetical protein MBLNU457_6837t1 [Dothideomycetes sp. NU457]